MTERTLTIKKNHTKTKVIVFAILVALLLLVTIFAKHVCPYDANAQDLSMSLKPPSVEHPFGTDRYGRDMLSRVIMGAQTSIFATLSLVVIICITGTMIGVICGFVGGKVDAVVMRISDICLAFPGLVFALAVAAVLNGGIENAVIALAVISWPKYSRIARSQTLAMTKMEYIYAARMAKETPWQIIIRHILPNIAGPILVTAMLDIGTMLMELAGLSFLGLGAQPPTAEWGSMMSSGRSMLQTYPWVVISPGIGIFISVVLFNLLGDAVRDYLDPKNRYMR